jgi:hypothetical protein
MFINAPPHISLLPSQGLLSIDEERAARVDVRLHTPEDPRGIAKDLSQIHLTCLQKVMI